MTLTPREQKVLDFLRAYVARYGISPSYDKISDATGIRSKSNIAYILDTLAWRKYIRRGPGRACNIELLQTEDYHRPDCECQGCAEARYQRGLQLVQALQVAPKVTLAGKLNGLRPLSHLARLDWLNTTNDRRKPRFSRTKTLNNLPHHDSRGAA